MKKRNTKQSRCSFNALCTPLTSRSLTCPFASLLHVHSLPRGLLTQVAARPVIAISARVHPGESNASWMMHGILRFLTGDSKEVSKQHELNRAQR